mgnify:FL=1
MRIITLLLLFLSAVSYSFAQEKPASIVGEVKNELGEELIFVKCILYTPDSVFVKGTETDLFGKFELQNIKSGAYYLKFEFIGFEPKYIQIENLKPNTNFRVKSVVLTQEDIQITEDVEITATKKLIETTIDKKIYDPSQDLSTQGGTVEDILRNVPSVEVDENGTISLRGNSNVTILVDGLPSTLTAGNLDALPANSIERVELVTNPSAKYDPDGTAGIINIVLKKQKLRGVNGSVSLNAGTGPVLNGNINFNARNEKVNFFFSYGARHYEGFRNSFSYWDTDLGDTLLELNQLREGTDLNQNQNMRLGADFNLKNRQTFGFSVNGNIGLRERTGDQINNRLYNQDLNDYWNRLSKDPIKRRSIDFTLNYQKKFNNKGGDLKLSANQSFGNTDTEGFYEERYYSDFGNEYRSPFLQEINNESKNNVLTLALDVTKYYQKDKKLEYGAKYIGRSLDKIAYSESYDTLTQNYNPDINLNNQFVYDESIFAAYGIFGQQVNKFGYQIGLRLEQALTEPRLINTNENFENNYFSFFPSANVLYKLKEKHTLTLSYSRRINRPSARTLNPFPSFSDPLNLRVGNPDLNPEYINAYELVSQRDWKNVNLTSSLYVRHTTSQIQRIKEFYDNGTSAVTYKNLDDAYNYGLEVIGVYKPYKWLRNLISFNGYGISIQDDGSTPNLVNNQGFSWNVKLNSSFTFWNNSTTFQISTAYVARRITAQGWVKPRRGLDLSLQRKFFNNKFTAGLRVSDVFDNQGFEYYVEQGNLEQQAEFKWQTRRFYLNLSYRFGKLEMGREKRGGGASGADFDF